MTDDAQTTNAAKCPLCGRANECAIAAGRPPESCWCMTATMDPEALASIPPEAQGKVCICAQCAGGGGSTD